MSSPLSCDPQFYCPAGTVAQFKCAEGHERHTGTEEECITCEDGFYCDALVGDEGNKVICPEGACLCNCYFIVKHCIRIFL